MKKAAAAVLAGLIAAADAQAQVPLGAEFRVDGGVGGRAYPASDVARRTTALTPDGEFVVVWTAPVGGDYDVFARRFGGDAVPRGPAFRVNTYATGRQFLPAVAIDAVGNFVVVWSSQVGSVFQGVFGRRFTASGAPRGAEFLVPAGFQSRQPSVASTPAGEFVVVWEQPVPFPARLDIFGQRYDAAGAALGAVFAVSGFAPDNHRPTADRDAAGDFVVAWSRVSPITPGVGLAARRYTAGGAPIGPEFAVPSGPTGGTSARVAQGAAGDFVVAWTSADYSDTGIAAHRFDAGGQPIGVPFPVNAYTTGEQMRPEIDAGADGGFVVTWTSDGQDGSLDGVYGRRYDASGVAGPEFRINEATTGAQHAQSVATDPAGNFLTMWYSVASSTGTVWARRHAAGLAPVALAVDASAGPSSDGNGVLEAGETVAVAPTWLNGGTAAQAVTGTATTFSGPGVPGDPAYTIADGTASYGTVPAGVSRACTSAADCYALAVTAPSARPAAHWDAAFRETLAPPSLAATKLWTLHVGDSFADVPRSSPFYRFVETLFHRGVTGGCTLSTYCPSGPTAREQMAVFVLMAREGPGYAPPACATPMFTDLPATSPFCPWVEELARRGVIGGCGAGRYCPDLAVSREQMAVFVLGALDPALVPPPCAVPPFGDVAVSSPFCRWIAELAARGIVAGCGGGDYCPDRPVTREQMAVFVSAAFAFALYGP